MGFALCFGSQTPNPFYPFCHRRNKGTHGMGALARKGSHHCWKSAKGLQEEIPGIHRSSRPSMASTNPSSIISDNLYSLDDKLKRGRPLPLLKNACEDVAVGKEPMPKTASVIDPASISRCCIEKGLFRQPPYFFSICAASARVG
ncbi:uncharacterized protein Pyn_36816 [Prunus yedoensis var. nudiflora]|uniref:Uncharacterized protein n=1 Tax=Prunus yedoensis var. nudiflora TaxID=2094558 RepID=A0A314UNQ3_PRUYE|nr:uncharacterized protein Pyn_36816 [Prunus yedoensis var. nudiflora]